MKRSKQQSVAIQQWDPDLVEATSKERESRRLSSILRHEGDMLGNDGRAELQQESMRLAHEGRKLRHKAEASQMRQSVYRLFCVGKN